MPNIAEDKIFTKISAQTLLKTADTFENCLFVNCNFSEAHISGIMFMDCRFEGCNLALVKFSNSGLQNILFKDCKLSGTDFSQSLDFLFGVSFDSCIMDNAIFLKKKNKQAIFTNCSLIEADFTQADLSEVKFNNCNLLNAHFSHTQLKNTDFRTAYNYTINPEDNTIKKARFSTQGLPGLLSKYDIRIED